MREELKKKERKNSSKICNTQNKGQGRNGINSKLRLQNNRKTERKE